MLFCSNDTATTEIYPLPLHDALPFFASRDPIDLGSELVVAHHDRVARGERVEQELGPHLTLRARPELLAEPRDRLRARGALGQPEVEALEERLGPTLDERRGDVEGVAREQLI